MPFLAAGQFHNIGSIPFDIAHHPRDSVGGSLIVAVTSGSRTPAITLACAMIEAIDMAPDKVSRMNLGLGEPLELKLRDEVLNP